MVEYESNGVGKGFTIFFMVVQSLITMTFLANVFRDVRYQRDGQFISATWLYRLGRSLTALAGCIVIAFYILILKKRDYLGNRPYLKCLPLLGAFAIDIAGDVVLYRALGIALVNNGNFYMEFTGCAIGYLIVYLLYSFAAGIRPYKPVEDSKNTFAQA